MNTLAVESRYSGVGSIHRTVLAFHRFVDEKDTVGLGAVVFVDHFVVFQDVAATLYSRVGVSHSLLLSLNWILFDVL